jgi:transketolase C-terminal domain/subunit
MKPDTITIDDVKYVRADSIKATDGDIKIVVADRGFVYVGHLEETENYAVLRNAKNIRIWGTTKGLSELVGGPTSKTVLDVVGIVRVPNRAVISIIDVEQSKWNTR